MNDDKPTLRFWLGNGVMALALLMLLSMGQLWDSMGEGALVVWIMLVAIGVYLLLGDKNRPPSPHD